MGKTISGNPNRRKETKKPTPLEKLPLMDSAESHASLRPVGRSGGLTTPQRSPATCSARHLKKQRKAGSLVSSASTLSKACFKIRQNTKIPKYQNETWTGEHQKDWPTETASKPGLQACHLPPQVESPHGTTDSGTRLWMSASSNGLENSRINVSMNWVFYPQTQKISKKLLDVAFFLF